jgi:hypothetical protein
MAHAMASVFNPLPVPQHRANAARQRLVEDLCAGVGGEVFCLLLASFAAGTEVWQALRSPRGNVLPGRV